MSGNPSMNGKVLRMTASDSVYTTGDALGASVRRACDGFWERRGVGKETLRDQMNGFFRQARQTIKNPHQNNLLSSYNFSYTPATNHQ